MLIYELNPVVRDNVVVRHKGNGIEIGGVTNAQILENYTAGNGIDLTLAFGYGIGNDNTSSATIANNYILGNRLGGIVEDGASVLTAQISNNIILGNGGSDLSLRGTDDTLTGNICDTSNPPDLCPYPLPRFPFDTVPKGKGHPR